MICSILSPCQASPYGEVSYVLDNADGNPHPSLWFSYGILRSLQAFTERASRTVNKTPVFFVACEKLLSFRLMNSCIRLWLRIHALQTLSGSTCVCIFYVCKAVPCVGAAQFCMSIAMIGGSVLFPDSLKITFSETSDASHVTAFNVICLA